MNIAKLITDNNIKIDPQQGAVFVKHKGREVSCLYSATDGDKEKALYCALHALAQLCGLETGEALPALPAKGLSTIRYGKSEPVRIQDGFNRNPEFNHIRQLAAQMAAKEMRK